MALESKETDKNYHDRLFQLFTNCFCCVPASTRHRPPPSRAPLVSPTPFVSLHLLHPQLPVLHERRRFTDIMDEEIDDERRSRIDKYSAEQGHYVPRRLRYELSARPRALAEADAVREQKRQGQVGGRSRRSGDRWRRRGWKRQGQVGGRSRRDRDRWMRRGGRWGRWCVGEGKEDKRRERRADTCRERDEGKNERQA